LLELKELPVFNDRARVSGRGKTERGMIREMSAIGQIARLNNDVFVTKFKCKLGIPSFRSADRQGAISGFGDFAMTVIPDQGWPGKWREKEHISAKI
jgi:hypothetical protein